MKGNKIYMIYRFILRTSTDFPDFIFWVRTFKFFSEKEEEYISKKQKELTVKSCRYHMEKVPELEVLNER